MIDPRELRIGNYVICGGKISKVEGLTIHNGCEDIEPIPLTEEWLVRLGFEKDYDKSLPYQVAYIKNKLVLNADFQITIEGREGDLHTVGKPIKYVHRLQNLSFDLK